jgi:hypothetical protein
MIVIGLRALREFVRAFQDEIDEKRYISLIQDREDLETA